jgi:hypothetical protein
MYRSLAVLAVLPLVVLAPAAPVPPGAEKPVPYFPTKVGAKWVYEQPEYQMTLLVTKVEAAEGGSLVTVENVVEGGKHIPIHKVLVTKTGVAFTEEAGEAYTPPWVHLRLPHRAGAEWDTTANRLLLANGALMTFHSAATDRGEEEVRVPAGTFRALRVDSEWSANGQGRERKKEWFAPGVGTVKIEWANTVRVLKSFTPGKD